MMSKIRVAILEHHHSIIKGYLCQLDTAHALEVVSVIRYGNELEERLAAHDVDVLLTDISLQAAASDANPYPILKSVPHFLRRQPELAILVLTMDLDREMIRTAIEAGASGYALKDDHVTIRNLREVIGRIAQGECYFSKQVLQTIMKRKPEPTGLLLSPKQMELLFLWATCPDMTTAELAGRLLISPSLARAISTDTFLMLKVSSRRAAVLKAAQMGLLTPADPDQYP